MAGADVVLDLLGGQNDPAALRSLRPGGHLVSALWDDPGVDEAEVTAQGLRLSLVQVTASGADLDRLDGLVAEGRPRVHVEEVLPLAETAKAHEISERPGKGKLVLVP